MDWWAFGVLTYEMLLGQSPFRGEDEDEIFDAILEDEPLYPITMPRDAVSLLQRVSMKLRVSCAWYAKFCNSFLLVILRGDLVLAKGTLKKSSNTYSSAMSTLTMSITKESHHHTSQ